MTAIFMARMPEGIVVAADGAFYGGDGALTHVASKILLLPESDCVITFQGPWFYHPVLRVGLAAAVGFDAILARIADLMTDAYVAAADEYEHSRVFSMLIGGYSQERKSWETYWLNSEPWEEGMAQPYTAWELTPAFATAWTPTYGRDACLAVGMDPARQLNEQGFGVVEAAVRIIAAARCEPLPKQGNPALGLICQVGGFVQVAHLGRSAASTEIAHRWPDVIGERLDPARGALTPWHQAPVAG